MLKEKKYKQSELLDSYTVERVTRMHTIINRLTLIIVLLIALMLVAGLIRLYGYSANAQYIVQDCEDNSSLVRYICNNKFLLTGTIKSYEERRSNQAL